MVRRECVFCAGEIREGEAAVAVCADREDAAYVPFVEDLCAEYTWLMHAACFGRENSVDSLVDVIHEHDRVLRSEVEDLRQRALQPV
jgi:hypothetical protein